MNHNAANCFADTLKLSDKPRKKRSDVSKPREYTCKLPSKYLSYIKRANVKQLEFTLTLDEFNNIIDGHCVYCGDPSTTIDRIDSSEGYTIDNCQPCCYTCNMMKFTNPSDKFIKQVKKIYNHLYK